MHLRTMRICYLIIFFVSFFGLGAISSGIANASATGFWIMSADLGLGSSSNWDYYNGPDAPEGGYLGWLHPGKMTLDGLVNLPQSLGAGRYYIYLKVVDYDADGQIDIDLGGSRVTVGTNSRDANGYWTVPGTIDLTSSADRLTLVLKKTVNSTVTQKYLVRGIYITRDPDEYVDRYDRVVNLHYPLPEELDNSPPKKGNLIVNSSFEVGLGYGWGTPYYGRNFPISSLLDKTVSYHGKSSLKVPSTRELISKIFHLKPNKKYTFSIWVRSNKPNGCTIQIKNVSEAPQGYSSTTDISKNFNISTSWQRISISDYLLNYPTSDYQIHIITGGDDNAYTWIDAVQLEEGGLSSYLPANTLEVGLTSNQASNIYYSDETVSMTLNVNNTTQINSSGSVNFEIYDIHNEKVKFGSIPVSISPESTISSELNLGTGKQGIFRVLLWVDNNDDSAEEVVFAVIPRPQISGPDESSIIGIHSNHRDFEMSALQKMGIKWTRALSPGAYFRWGGVEPADNMFYWYDEEVQRASNYGLTIMATTGTNDQWPAWADLGGLPDLDKWGEYIEQLVMHYKNYVKYWEIWNEPDNYFTPSFYAEMLKRASASIKKADPDAKIVGMGGNFSIEWIQQVIFHLGDNWQQYMDYISTHLYPSNGPVAYNFAKEIIEKYNIEVWNTETGYWDLGFYTGTNSNFFVPGQSIYPHREASRYYVGSLGAAEAVAKNFLHSIGNGLSKYFYYDSRLISNPGYLKSHPTILEYDDTIRSKGVVYSVLSSIFDHSRGLGNISTDQGTYAYLFDRQGTPIIAIWTDDSASKSISIPGIQLSAYDFFGNPLVTNASVIKYGKTPLYLYGNSLTRDQIVAAFQSATYSVYPDVTPPSVSIVEWPTGPLFGQDFGFRWIAIDDYSMPSDINPEAILYSYRLLNNTDWSTWSPATTAHFSNIPAGQYTLEVLARDGFGNVSQVGKRTISIGNPGSKPSPPVNLQILTN